MRTFFLLLLISSLLSGAFQSLSAQQAYFPPADNEAWETTSPAALGWDSEALAEMLGWLEEQQTRAFIILKDGRIVVEQYFGISRSTPWYWASAGKTVTAALVGALENEDALDLHAPSAAWLGEGWTSLTPEQEAMITPWHQLTMTTGLDYAVDDQNCTLPGCLQFRAEAGTQWYYHNAPYTLLTHILEASSGLELNQLTQQKMTAIPGLSGFYADGASGFNRVFVSNALSKARFGLFVRHGTSWAGNDPLLSEEFFTQMISPSQNLNPAYGYLWWINGQESFIPPNFAVSFPGMLLPDAPADTYAAMGMNAQILNIVPSEELIVVRMGQEPETNIFAFTNELWQRLNQVRAPATSVVPEMPAGFRLEQNYPNPFNPATVIRFHLPEASVVNLDVYDVLGRHVQSLVNGQLAPGAHSVRFDAGGLAGGFYLYRLRAGDKVLNRQMLLLK